MLSGGPIRAIPACPGASGRRLRRADLWSQTADRRLQVRRAALEPFSSSADRTIADAAEATQKVYGLLVEVNEQFVTEISGTLDAASRGEQVPLGQLTARLATLNSHRDDVWKLLPSVTATSLYALVAFGKHGEGTGRLRVTRRQRAELLQELERVFGAEVKRGASGGPTSQRRRRRRDARVPCGSEMAGRRRVG